MNEIYIDDVIGGDYFYDEGTTNRGIRETLDSMSGDIRVFISSPGGSVFEGHDIYNSIKDYDRGSVQIVIGSIAASIASVIMLAGDGLPMVRANSSIMIHDPSTIVMGTAAEMRQTADTLDTIKETIISVYKEAVPGDSIDFNDLMAKESWFTAQQAIDMGLAIAYDKAQPAPTNQTELHGLSYQDLMAAFKDSVKPVIEPVIDPVIDPIIENTLPNLEARKRFLEIQSDDC
jgi:ATP-dependent Clp protease protease subunit